ncbi:MAG: C-GCAxxG-C-C family protein, partial [Candidatus Lindowbacteria bacterium]|nr:C-GCAxxG-C-C family protein [Candidatus Lindowbacteria bacterium]
MKDDLVLKCATGFGGGIGGRGSICGVISGSTMVIGL